MKDSALSPKDKKSSQLLQKVLLHFETVEDWPDYISFLNKLQKAITSNSASTKHWIPHDLEVAIILSKCLSPNLPSGVHQKALEVYQLIFKELGIDTLSSKVNVWIPGILPIMQFASISIKPLVIQLYKDFLLTMPARILKPLIKPILSYLFCSIDDERSEFFDTSLDLIDKFRTELNDDLFFWQSVFMVIITSEEKRLGALVWCNKRLPDLNVVIGESEVQGFDYKKELYQRLTTEQKALIEPEPGLLVRAFITSLQSENLLIQRGFFDILIKNLQLNSTVLQKLTKSTDLQNLITSVTYTILIKDMSLNRRVWNWLLGPEDSNSTAASQELYFQKNGFELLSEALLKLINGEYFHESTKTVFEQKISSFKICLAIMDKWEIGSLIIPRVLLPALKSIKDSVDTKATQWEEVLKSGGVLFDAIETIIIFQNLFKELNEGGDEEFLCFILQNFNVNDEEMIVHQLPLLLITVLIRNSKTETFFKLVKLLLDLIPQRAFLPIEHAVVDHALEDKEVLLKINRYYNENDDVMNLPFNPADLSFILLRLATELASNYIGDDKAYQYLEILNLVVDTIPLLEFREKSFLNILQTNSFENTQSIIQVSRLFVKYKFETPFVQQEALQNIIHQLLSVLFVQNSKYQIEIVKVIQALTFDINSHYIEAAISSYLLSLSNFSKRLEIFNYLWIHSTDDKFLNRPLYIILDELNNQEDSDSVVKSILNNWILRCSYIGFGNRLFQILTLTLHESLDDFEIFKYHASLLYKILCINSHIHNLFGEELVIINSVEFKDLNGFTYRDFTLWVLSNFLTHNSDCFDSTVLNAIFKLTERLLNGKDNSKILDSHFLKVFEISSQFILNYPTHPDFDLISIVLISHLTRLIKLSIECSKSSSDSILLIKNDKGKSSLIEFLLSSFDKFNTPELLETLLNLLSTLLKLQDGMIFQYVESIALTILKKVEDLYSKDVSKDDVSISLLLTHLKDILLLLRTYVITLEINDPSSQANEDSSHSGFFTSVVSNVFNADSGKKEGDDESTAVRNRRVLVNCFDKTTHTCSRVWLDSDSVLKSNGESQDNEGGGLSLKYQAMKLKHKSKTLLESLYELEPIEILKSLIQNNKTNSTEIFKLLHVLDGARPKLTIPHIFKLFKLSVKSTSKPTINEVSEFLNNYTLSLQDDSIEDIFQDTVNFLRYLISEINSYPKNIALGVLKFNAIIAEKLAHSKFGELKKVKRETNDIFLKSLPIALSSKNNSDLSLALSTTIGQEEETLADDVLTSSQQLEPVSAFTNEEECINIIRYIVPRIKYIVSDADKQGAVVSTISVNFLASSFVKSSKSSPYEIRTYQLDLLDDLVTYYPGVKSLKFLVSEVFNDAKFFKIRIDQLPKWNDIIKHWLGYDETNANSPNETATEKISELLTKSVQSTSAAVNIFNWNENEQNLAKLLNLRRISYLLLISDKDKHIVLLKEIFDKLDELLSGRNLQGSDELSSLLNLEIFTILRVVILKFSSIHLYDYWTFIYTSLQRFFSKLLNASEKELGSLKMPSLLAACKLLDTLLVLKFEDFQEWIFIIDTINAIFKNYDIISLIDTISNKDELFKDKTHSEKTKIVLTKLSDFKGLKRPALLGVREVDTLLSLKPFFEGLSYYNYENVYNGVTIDYESCLADIYSDIFDDSSEQ